MSKSDSPPPVSKPVLQGVLDCVGVPALGLGLTMVGFGAMCQESGFELLPALGSTALVWGIAGQIALIDIQTNGGGLITLFVAVSLANLRMLPMTVTGLDTVIGGRRAGTFLRVLIAQFMAITCWVQMTSNSGHIPNQQRMPYYFGFATMLVTAGLIGTTLGHQLGRVVPPEVLTIAIFMTPFYLLLIICGARQWVNRFSVAFGAALGLSLYPTVGDWSVPIAGLLGGTMGFLSGRRFFPNDPVP